MKIIDSMNSAKLVFSGNDYFNTLEKCIDDAQEVIHVQMYIFDEDETARRIAKALIRASERKVEIYILLDAYGSKMLSFEFINEFLKAGIHFRFFSPLFSNESIHFGRRLHYKVIVIDKCKAIVGGINIANKYCGNESSEAWLDYAVLINSEACNELHQHCEDLYNLRSLKKFNKGNEFISFALNDWIRGRNDIYRNMLKAFRRSEKSIVIVSSYFLPGYKYLKELKEAGKRGVKVNVILGKKSDLPFLLFAEKHLYKVFFDHEISIYEWQSSVLHGKAIMVDDQWASLGSYNINFLSRYISMELNAEIRHPEFLSEFNEHLNDVMNARCKPLSRDQMVQSSNIFSRTRNAIAYYMVRLIMKMFLRRRDHE